MLGLLSSLGVGRLLVLALAAFAAYAVFVQPTWAVDAWTGATERVLLALGAGVIPVALWALVVVATARYRPFALVRRWRLLIGSAALVVAALAILAYFEASLPVTGQANLGGSYGLQVRGDNAVLGLVRLAIPGLLGLWVVMPRRSPGVVRWTAARLRWAGALLPLITRVGQAGRVTGRLFSRIAASAPRRRDGEGARLARDIGDVLTSGQAAGNPESALPAAPMAAPMAPEALPPGDGSVTTKSHARETGAGGGNQKAPAADWALPSLSLLTPAGPVVVAGDEQAAVARLIEDTLGQHGVEVSVAEVRPGPTVTMYGLVPGWNRRGSRVGGDTDKDREVRNRVKVDSIVAREKDLALALAAPSLRIEAPVPGESVVGVEVPNRRGTMVPIRAVMESDAYNDLVDDSRLAVALGQATAGEPVVLDLASMPHLLIAGATGSGKSVCINSIVASLIAHHQPSKVRLLLVDPKRVELTPYNGIPHLLTPVIVDTDRVVRLLRGAIQEMLRRYRLLEGAGVRNLQSYNRSHKAAEHLPYLVICIDELADLMMTSSFDVEQAICRLAQLGRATGIHLVVATQRPSVDVVTGLIKANFPSRISFAVASQVDSRTILDTVGADRLLGRGDMLFLAPDSAKPRRVQGVFLSEEETEALAEHWRHQTGPALPEIPLEELAREAETASAMGGANEDASGDDHDTLFQKALDLAGRSRQLSTSLLQRRLRIGYPRAARLMDQLEDEGIVAPSGEAGKPRDVLYRPDDERLV